MIRPFAHALRLFPPRLVSRLHHRPVSTETDTPKPSPRDFYAQADLYAQTDAEWPPPASPEPPGQRAHTWARENDVAFPSALRSLKVRPPHPLTLTATYSREHVFHPWHLRFLGAHAYCEQTLRRYRLKKAVEPLWWYVVLHTDKDLKSSAFVRNSMRKKLNWAFCRALARRTYSSTGNREVDPGMVDKTVWEKGKGPPRERFAQLRGSLKIEGQVGGMLGVSMVVLKKYCDEVVMRLEEELGIPEAQLEREMASKIRQIPKKDWSNKALPKKASEWAKVAVKQAKAKTAKG